MEELAKLLETNHYKNENGCWLTEYSNIPGLEVDASTINGTSGLGVWRGRRVYWSTTNLRNYGRFTVESLS